MRRRDGWLWTGAMAASAALTLAASARAEAADETGPPPAAVTAVKAFKAICLDEFTGTDLDAAARFAQNSEYKFHFSKEGFDTNTKTDKWLDNGQLYLTLWWDAEAKHKSCEIAFDPGATKAEYAAAIVDNIKPLAQVSNFDQLDGEEFVGVRVAMEAVSDVSLWRMADKPNSNPLLPHFIEFGGDEARPGLLLLQAIYDYLPEN